MQNLPPVSGQGRNLRDLPTFQRGLRQEQEHKRPESNPFFADAGVRPFSAVVKGGREPHCKLLA